MSASEKSGKRALITGASGFIGYHIAHHLLNEGYKVRAAARGVKVERLRQALSTVHDTSRLEVIDVPDIASGDFSEIFKVIHLAFPVTRRPDFELALHTAVQGSLHVLEEGVKAGVRNFVTTSSTATFNPVDNGWGVHDYTSTTEKEARTGGVMEIYRYTKALCDRKVLEFQDEHPEIDVTILAPCWVYGPFPPGFEHIVPEPDIPSISTNLFIYSLLAKNTAHCLPTFPGYVDARDVARIHELALKSRPASEVGHKRFVVISPHDSSWADAASHLAKERPGLKDRLLEAVDIPESPLGNSVVGINPDGLERAVGFRPSDYIKWEETVLETADSLLALEAGWKAKGFSVAVPTQAVV